MSDVNFNLKLAIDEFKKATNEAVNLTKGLSTTVNTSTKQMSTSWAVFTGGIQLEIFKQAARYLERMFVAPIESAAAAEVALNDLNIALRSSGNYSQAASKDLNDYADALQDTSIYSGDAVLGVMRTLESLTDLDKEGLKKATKSTIDFAAKYGKGVDEAATMVSKALEGNIVAFQRMGIKIKSGSTDAERLANLMAALASANGAAEAKLNTFSGALAHANNMFGEILDAAGNTIVQSPQLISMINTVAASFMGVAGSMQTTVRFISKHSDVFISLAVGIGSVVTALGLYAVATSAATTATLAFIAANTLNPIFWIGAAIAAVIASITFLVLKFDEVKLAVLNFAKSAMEAFINLNSTIGNMIVTFLPFIGILGKIFRIDTASVKANLDAVNAAIDKTKAKINEKNAPIVDPNEAARLKKEQEEQAANRKAANERRLEAQKQLNATLAQMAKQSVIEIGQANREGDLAIAQQESEAAFNKKTAEIANSQQNLTQKNDANVALMEQRAAQQAAELVEIQTQEAAKLDLINQAEIDKAQLLTDSEAKKKALAETQVKNDLAVANLRNKQALDTVKLQNTNEAKLDTEKTKNKKEQDAERVSNQRDTFSSIATLSSSNNKTLAFIGKAAAITQIAIDTPVAISKALAAFPPPFNFIAAGLVGTAMAVQAAKVASIGNFANGGIIPGSSFSGDKLQANVNSGEMILNQTQQKQLFDQANGNGSNSSLLDAINNLGNRIATMEIKLFTNDDTIALATSRGMMNGVILGASR